MALIASLFFMRRGAKILNVGGRMEDMDWPAEALREAIWSMALRGIEVVVVVVIVREVQTLT